MSPRPGRLVAAAVGALALLAAPTGARAQVLTSGCANPTFCTLNELFAGGSIQVDDKHFKQWGLEVLDASFGAVPDLNLITVEGLSALPDPNNADPGPGFRIFGNGELLVSGVQYIDLRIGFHVDVTSPPEMIKDASANLVSSTRTNNAFIHVTEWLSNPSGSLGLGQLFIDQDFVVFSPFSVATFDRIAFPPQDEIYCEKDLHLEGTLPSDFAEIQTLEQRYSQLPEPAQLVMLGCGVASLFLLSRRRAAERIRRQEVRCS